MSKIMVVGSLIVDIAAYTPHFPVKGETTLGKRLQFGPGGKGNNQATAAARVGGEVYMISKTGKDFLQGIMTEHYKNEGMTTQYIYVDEESVPAPPLSKLTIPGPTVLLLLKAQTKNLLPLRSIRPRAILKPATF